MNAVLNRHERKMQWQRNSRRAFKAAHGYSTAAHYATGGNREAILERDNFACVRCGMTDEQHKAKWDRPITIDHISKDRSDNSDDNLQTLCLTCHGNKDLIPRLRIRLPETTIAHMRAMRAEGNSYQSIADANGVGISTAWNYLRGKR